MAWVLRFHWYWRLVPVAVTLSVTLVPAACVVDAAGWAVICGAITLPPELELLEEDELDEDELELLEELLELDELELLDEDDEELELPPLVVISAVVMVYAGSDTTQLERSTVAVPTAAGVVDVPERRKSRALPLMLRPLKPTDCEELERLIATIT